MKIFPSYYRQAEEKINVITHAFGFLLSVIAFIFFIKKSIELQNLGYAISTIVYAVSLMVLYAASTGYHSAKRRKLRARLNIFDHAAIYILIAGTYTPFTLITLKGTLGYILFSIVWAVAVVGVILKLFYTGKFKLLSTIMYVAMGWIVIFAIKPLLENLPTNGIWLLFAGGFFYTLGAVLFMFDKLKFNHAIFHVFVLLGSISHFLAIYFYVNPH
ncbi:PAQR family membrane homeostasis protein TrhA [Mesonia mobilis]|uniref:PAQR family membrane homeostasis protein TrhA n=1 Tax=Mesonia mobilis TaxID=369791 RepID=UPI0024BA050A|nr:hemolysin III family protein [Mesonia mobilis]